MKNILNHLIRSAAFVALFTSTATIAMPATPPENGKSAVATTPTAIARTYPFRGTVGTADPSGKTVSLAGRKTTRILHVDPASKLDRSGHDITLPELQTGDYLKGLLTKDASGREILVKATAGEKAAPKSTADRTTNSRRTSKSGKSSPDTNANADSTGN